MSIMEYNGSALVAMTGKDCVAIASDRRFGSQQTSVSNEMRRVFKMNDKILMGLSGLGTDVQTCQQKLAMKTNMFRLKQDRDIKPSVFANMVSSFLYQRRFGPYFIEPLIAGLEGEDNKPFISSQDLLGAQVFTKDFLVAGTAEDSLYGTCETFYKPNLEADDLFEVISQCVLSAVDRDCYSGWGLEVHILTPTEHIVRHVKGRSD